MNHKHKERITVCNQTCQVRIGNNNETDNDDNANDK